jgi:hypothetical protein
MDFPALVICPSVAKRQLAPYRATGARPASFRLIISSIPALGGFLFRKRFRWIAIDQGLSCAASARFCQP